MNQPALKSAAMPERMCIVTRKVDETQNLLRFVKGPDGVIVPDLRCRLPGRGVWVGLDRELVQTAVEKNLFARGVKSSCSAPDNLAEMVDNMLASSCMNYLSFAKKAGELVTGHDKVVNLVKKGKVAVLIAALDGAEDGKRKLQNLFLRHFEDGKIINLFDCSQLSLALGSANVIHAAITHGTLAEKFDMAAEKLLKYRGETTG